jgi:hypothetical protein
MSDRQVNPDWLSPAEVGARWGIDADTVRRNLFVPRSPDDMTPAGKLRAAKMFGQYRVHRSVVEAFERVAFPPKTASRRRRSSARCGGCNGGAGY